MMIFAFFLMIAFSLNAQTPIEKHIFGYVINQNQEVLSFVNIGIKGKNFGTVTDQNGEFALIVPEKLIADSLTFSSIGYHTYTIAISDFSGESTSIILEEKKYSLPEIVVRDVVLVKKQLGNTKAKTTRSINFGENELGNELGALIEIKKPSRLLSFHGTINKSDFDSLFFRLNLYTKDGFENYISVLDENIFVNLKPETKLTEIEVDLRPYEIYVDDDILVSMEQISELGDGVVQFALQRKGSTWVRAVSLANWYQAPLGGIGFYIWVETEK